MTRTTLRKLAAGGLLVLSSIVVPATAAQASLSSCSSWYPNETQYAARCTATGDSYYRAVTGCYSVSSGAYVTTRYGAYLGDQENGSASYATCPSGTYAASGYIEKHP